MHKQELPLGTLLPPHVREQLITAATSPVNDAQNPELERARRVFDATERVKKQYPQYFQQEEVQ